jgi:hypothetical protein
MAIGTNHPANSSRRRPLCVLGLFVTLAMSASSPEAGEIAQRREEQRGDPYIGGLTNKL